MTGACNKRFNNTVGLVWLKAVASMPPYLRLLLGLLCLTLVFTKVSWASSLRISPVSLDLPDTQQSAAISLTNTGDEAVNLQLRVFEWLQHNGEDQLVQTSDLIVSPPAATVPAGLTYTVRLARQVSTPQADKSYRLLIDEIPKALDPRAVNQGVSMVLRSSLPIFFSEKNAIVSLVWSLWRDHDAIRLEVQNQGKRHAKISALSLHTASGESLTVGEGLNTYVLAGAHKQFSLQDAGVHKLNDGEPLYLRAKNGRLIIEQTLAVQEQ